MPERAVDIATVRYRNALLLFDEFVRATVSHPDAATLRGLERRFAERVQVQPSYWSQIKSRARQIGERLARQFEVHCGKPHGWMDQPHGVIAAVAVSAGSPSADAPRDDDERFVVSLVLGYYRRDPQRAKARLLQLLGEALQPVVAPVAKKGGSAATPHDADVTLWTQAARGVAPLKRKR